jgi:hypothetical protein
MKETKTVIGETLTKAELDEAIEKFTKTETLIILIRADQDSVKAMLATNEDESKIVVIGGVPKDRPFTPVLDIPGSIGDYREAIVFPQPWIAPDKFVVVSLGEDNE